MLRRNTHSTPIRTLRDLAVAVLTLAACACSDQKLLERHSGPASAPASGQFSAEEKRTAQALSVGSEQVAPAGSSAYQQALKCQFAFPALSARIIGEGGGQTVGPAVEEAKAYFDRRLRTAASQENKTVAQIAADLKAQEVQFPDESAKIRMAVGCLRTLS